MSDWDQKACDSHFEDKYQCSDNEEWTEVCPDCSETEICPECGEVNDDLLDYDELDEEE